MRGPLRRAVSAVFVIAALAALAPRLIARGLANLGSIRIEHGLFIARKEAPQPCATWYPLLRDGHDAIDQGAALYGKSLAIDKTGSARWASVARARLLMGQDHDAYSALENALHEGGDPLAWLHYGFLLERLGRHGDAVASWRRIPDFETVALGIGRRHELLGESSEALRCYELAVDVAPQDGNAAAAKGRILMSLQRPQEAQPVLTSALDQLPRGPARAMAQAYRAAARSQLGDAAGAVADCDSAATTAPRSYDVHWMCGNISLLAHDEARALQHWLIAVDLEPSQPGPYEQLAGAYVKRHDVQRALSACRKLETHVAWRGARCEGHVFLAQGDYLKANSAFTTALHETSDPASASGLEELVERTAGSRSGVR